MPIKTHKLLVINKMAEREGFEPSVELPLRSLSKGVLSTTQPSFLKAGREVSIIGRECRQPRAMDSLAIPRRSKFQAPDLALRLPQRALRPPQRALRSPQRSLRSPQRALRSSQRPLRLPQRALRSPQRNLRSPQRTLRSPQGNLRQLRLLRLEESVRQRRQPQ